jgi:hypothetical protein
MRRQIWVNFGPPIRRVGLSCWAITEKERVTTPNQYFEAPNNPVNRTEPDRGKPMSAKKSPRTQHPKIQHPYIPTSSERTPGYRENDLEEIACSTCVTTQLATEFTSRQ